MIQITQIFATAYNAYIMTEIRSYHHICQFVNTVFSVTVISMANQFE